VIRAGQEWTAAGRVVRIESVVRDSVAVTRISTGRYSRMLAARLLRRFHLTREAPDA
jgi:hypothetical protein